MTGVAVERCIVVFVFFGRSYTIALPSTQLSVWDTYGRDVGGGCRVARQGTNTTGALGGKIVFILYFVYSPLKSHLFTVFTVIIYARSL